MTKLSFVLAHEMRCWMLWSSSMLRRWLAFAFRPGLGRGVRALVKLVYKGRLHNLWLLCGGGGAHCRGRSAIGRRVSRIAVCRRGVQLRLGLRGGGAVEAGAIHGGRAHGGGRGRGDVHGVARRGQCRAGRGQDGYGLVEGGVVGVGREGASTGFCDRSHGGDGRRRAVDERAVNEGPMPAGVEEQQQQQAAWMQGPGVGVAMGVAARRRCGGACDMDGQRRSKGWQPSGKAVGLAASSSACASRGTFVPEELGGEQSVQCRMLPRAWNRSSCTGRSARPSAVDGDMQEHEGWQQTQIWSGDAGKVSGIMGRRRNSANSQEALGSIAQPQRRPGPPAPSAHVAAGLVCAGDRLRAVRRPSASATVVGPPAESSRGARGLLATETSVRLYPAHADSRRRVRLLFCQHWQTLLSSSSARFLAASDLDTSASRVRPAAHSHC